ncbi:MAG TPA: ABC transporter substrate-binding protein [Bacteriovoracaceae bacterium]|nr:ABC transporter substrate-binding protein [Bacteriovoracaceae bacterium]
MSCQKNDEIKMSLTPLKRGVVLDTSKIYFLNEYYILENLTVRLVEMDLKTGYKLMLASEIHQKSDLLYEIKIRETFFSNGEALTINDVINSLLRAKQSINSHVAFSEIVESITLEKDIIQIKLKKKVSDFLYYLTLADLSILHKSQLSLKQIKVENWETVSSGPFYYKVEGEDVYLIKNKFYTLSERNYPDRIKLISARGRDTFIDFKNEYVDIGEFNLNSYEKHISSLNSVDNLKVIGNNGDMVNFFALNVTSELFKKEYNRRWIQKKMILNYKLEEKYKNIARKAFQFFTPQVKGFASESVLLDEVLSWKNINTDVIPEELSRGFTVNTYQRAFEVSLKGAFKEISKVLGVNVEIHANVPSTDFETFVNKKEYDAFLGITAMDQVIVGESLNLYYFSSFPMFKDVNKKILPLMNKYQSSSNYDASAVLNEISLQMIKDAECIPIFYVASPFFYNTKKLDVSSLDELTYFNLWKIKVI